MMQSKTERLNEYGMYIRRTHDNTFNLGWTYSQRKGGIANFPTYDDAYNAFEEVIDAFWEYRGEDFQQHVEASLYQSTKEI